MSKLTDKRLAEIRRAAADTDNQDPSDLVVKEMLGHIDALTAERDTLAGQVAALREALEPLLEIGGWPHVATAWNIPLQKRVTKAREDGARVLADTEAAAKEHDRKVAEDAQNRLLTFLREEISDTFSDLTAGGAELGAEKRAI